MSSAGRIAAAVAVLSLSACPPARADQFTINATFDGSITSDANASTIEATINQAISMYESKITTPITVAIGFSESNDGLGSSTTYNSTVSYSSFLAALTASATSAADASALASLAGSGPNNPVDGNPNVTLSTANLRALGLGGVLPTGVNDSNIALNTSIMNLSAASNDPSKYSLLSVVEHEMDEVFGLGSNLDGGSVTGASKPEDLFRYASPGVRSYTNDVNALSYFSIDGGATNLTGFNQEGPPGGSDYGDWATSAIPQVQDAFGTPGTAPAFGPNEQAALDVIGYTFVSPAAVPEPASVAMVAIGLAAAGCRPRRRGSCPTPALAA